MPAECLMLVDEAAPEVLLADAIRARASSPTSSCWCRTCIAKDGGTQIIAGNEKVIRARLSDAKFFWEQDLKKPLDEMAMRAAGITFHEKLGTPEGARGAHRRAGVPDRGLGGCGAGGRAARGAARQGRSGVRHGGRVPRAAGPDGPLLRRGRRHQARRSPRAIELHYKPKGPTDTVPLASQGDAVAVAVALADKLDTLVGFWAIGEKPTGSGDPYQLRRAALGVIRIVLENDLRACRSSRVASRHLELVRRQQSFVRRRRYSTHRAR